MKVSVVMPSRNQGRFIAAAIESVIRQPIDGNLELLIRDCMSDDETPTVLARYADVPFVHVTREWDRGQSDALKRGFEESTGDILCWLNSDDIWLDHALVRVLEAFQSNPHADVVFGNAVFIDTRGAVVGSFPLARPNLRKLKNRCVLSQPSVFFRRPAYFSAGGVDAERRYCMDYELWLRLALNRNNFIGIPATLSGTRLHDETKTFNGGLAFIDEICAMQESLLGEVSPIWQIYRRTREPGLMKVRSKALRFLAASLRQVSMEPAALPQMAAASLERITAELAARARLLRRI